MTLSRAIKSIWAKSGYYSEGREWLPLWLHLQDTSTVARHLAKRWIAPSINDLIQQEFNQSAVNMDPREEFSRLASLLAALHDVGKATPFFAVQDNFLYDRMAESGLQHPHINSDERHLIPHALAGQVLIEQEFSKRFGIPVGDVEPLASVIGAHHGVPPNTQDYLHARNTLTNNSPKTEAAYGNSDWAEARSLLIDKAILDTQTNELLPTWLQHKWSQSFLVLLSGIVIVADWIASSADYFPLISMDSSGTEYLKLDEYERRWNQAQILLEVPTPWQAADTGHDPALLLHQRFNFPPHAKTTEAQHRIVEEARTMDLPGMLILEESTGSGKTEAALLAAEILAARTKRAGVLFALPTQATTDAMFNRVMNWLAQVEKDYAHSGAPSTYSVQLLHGRSAHNPKATDLRRRGYEIRDRAFATLGGENFNSGVAPVDVGIDERETPTLPAESTRNTAILSWFSGRKKSILSDFVVTTVDHVLFSALQSPHLAMRHLGIARKIVIIDEVHSYTSYMNEYLDRALTWLGTYGVPIILLSATLSQNRRSELAHAYRQGLQVAAGEKPDKRTTAQVISSEFPALITVNHKTTRTNAIEAAGRSSSVVVAKLPDEPLISFIKSRIGNGGCVLIVRNTVSRAQETFTYLQSEFGDIVSLHHARFTTSDRQANDDYLLKMFGKPTPGQARPKHAIVVATQVVEQSLDVDFDLLITDLAPIDLLIQRLGRVHRHKRQRPQGLGDPYCYVDCLPSNKEFPEFEGGAKAIYGLLHLLLTANKLHEIMESDLPRIKTPQDTRELIESVFGNTPGVPEPWRESLDLGVREHERTLRRLKDSARGFLLKPPPELRRHQTLCNWLAAPASVNENSKAQVRDGEDTLEVILVAQHSVGAQTEIRTLENAPFAPNTVIPTDQVPTPQVVKALAQSTVKLPANFTYGAAMESTLLTLEQNYFDAWQNNYHLRGQLILPLIEGKAVLNGRTLQYSSTTGLQEVSK